MKEFLEKSFFHNTIENYLWALGILVVAVLIVTALKYVIQKKIKRQMERNELIFAGSIPDRIMKYLVPLIHIGILDLSIQVLTIPSNIRKIFDVGMLAICIIFLAMIFSAVIEFSINKYSEKINTDANKQFAMHWVNKLAKGIIWGIAFILFIQNLGIEIGTLVAGLGIGGIAIAFAAQTILVDVFSYFTIFFDRTFEVGDFIITGEQKGTVEYIGIRTTRLRSIGGEQLIFPNKDLTNSRIQNFKEMEQRRVNFSLGVVYDTSIDRLKMIPELLKSIIELQENTRFDRAHFVSYGDSSLNFEVVYYVLSGDYNTCMDVQQQINLSIKEQFDELGIEFAFPTQTLHLHSQDKQQA